MSTLSVEIDGATIDYSDVGSGPVVVFIHGIFVGGSLWDDLIAELGEGFRCIAPTLPLGAHRRAFPAGADLSPEALGVLIVEFLEALDLQDVTLVANDTGGGLTLIALDSELPGLQRILRLVLSNCDSYEHFPPASMRPMTQLARRMPKPFGVLLGAALRRRFVRRKFLSQVAHVLPAPERLADWFDPLRDLGVRRDVVQVVGGLDPAATIEAAPAIARFDRPVLLAWGTDCEFFPMEHARRLEAQFPDATLRGIPASKTYVMIDQPIELARAIGEFVTGTSIVVPHER
jgi:pimeloyl-ACP methyl ester carboxylesterase